MTDQQILTKALQKAVSNGWNPSLLGNYEVPSYGFKPEKLAEQLDNIEQPSTADILFNIDFAKALWGDEEAGTEDFYSPKHNELSGSYWPKMWEYHLQQMVIADDLIKYLEKNI